MQLVFTVEEFIFLNHLLRECEADLQLYARLRISAPQLLDKFLNHDFGFSLDELEDLEEILKIEDEKLQQQIKAGTSPDLEEMQHRQLMLERLIDRVTEACAMA